MRDFFPENHLLSALKAGRAPRGTFNYIKDMCVIELLAEAGLDYVIIDTEHAVMDSEAVEAQIMVSQLNHITPYVRVDGIHPGQIRRFLESGAQGILIPHIKNAEDCRRAQDAMRYPPEGHASTCRSNHSTGYSGKNWLDYLDWVQNASFVAMVEDPEGLDNLDEILAELKPGRDLLMFGKADYTQALGLFDRSGQIDSPAVRDAEQKLARRCRESGIPLIAVPPVNTAEGIRKLLDSGVEVLCFNTDQNILMGAFTQIVSACKTLE